MLEITPTRSAYLELQEERLGMEEGYRFLDEKRLVLAAETLRELERYESMKREFMQLYGSAASALKGAIARHGINGLEIYPPNTHAWGDIERVGRSVLGLQVHEVSVQENQNEAATSAINASPEAEQTRNEFTHLITLAVGLAAITANLVRLKEEYQRTSRRARALEDVLLPEIDQTLSQIDTALEEIDKEEIVRVHSSIRS
jgi:V/A-type H+-transporting ATPase subunit D